MRKEESVLTALRRDWERKRAYAEQLPQYPEISCETRSAYDLLIRKQDARVCGDMKLCFQLEEEINRLIRENRKALANRRRAEAKQAAEYAFQLYAQMRERTEGAGK